MVLVGLRPRELRHRAHPSPPRLTRRFPRCSARPVSRRSGPGLRCSPTGADRPQRRHRRDWHHMRRRFRPFGRRRRQLSARTHQRPRLSQQGDELRRRSGRGPLWPRRDSSGRLRPGRADTGQVARRRCPCLRPCRWPQQSLPTGRHSPRQPGPASGRPAEVADAEKRPSPSRPIPCSATHHVALGNLGVRYQHDARPRRTAAAVASFCLRRVRSRWVVPGIATPTGSTTRSSRSGLISGAFAMTISSSRAGTAYCMKARTQHVWLLAVNESTDVMRL